MFFSTIQPIMFVLLFNYVFGGALVPGGGDKYIDYLLPGIMVQTVAFGATSTAIGLATDMGTGIIDRFRSLPMARSAVLSGRTSADAVRNLFVVILMVVVGTVIGFRFHNGALLAVASVLLAVLFGFAFSWVFAFIGLKTGDAETAQLAGFAIIFPLVFASSAFVPTASDARLAAGLRQPPTRDGNGERHPPPEPRRRPRLAPHAVAPLDRRHHRRVRTTGRGPLPQGLSTAGAGR